MKKLILIISVLLFGLVVSTSFAAEDVTLFDGTFTRNTGAPVVASRTFRAVSGLATVNLTNTGISSASITINGVEVFRPSEFNQNVRNIEKEVTLNEGQNSLTVLLKSGPGGAVRIQIHMPVEVMLAPTAKVLDDATINNLSSISEDGMTLFFAGTTPQIDSMQTGDVIISGVTALTPKGMLRMVVSIEKRGDGSVVVITEPASLTDAFQELHIKGTIPSAGTAAPSLQKAPMISPMAAETVTMPPITFQIPGTNFSVSGSYDSTLSGDFSFHPDLDYEIDISWFTLKKFKLVFRGSQALALNQQLQVKESGSWSPEVPLSPEPILITTIPIIGVMIITVEFIPSIGLAASFEGAADLSIGFTESLNLTAGFEYSNDSWSAIGSCDGSFDPYFSVAGETTFSIKPYFRPRLGFYFWDMAGPYIDLQPYGKWSFTTYPEVYGELGYGINGNVGGELKFLTKTFADIHLELFDFYWPLFPNVTPPLISGRITNAGGAGVPGVTVNLSGTHGTVDVTDTNGNYNFMVEQNETYIITPMLAGYTFDPPTRTVTVSEVNVIGQDFISSPPFKFSIVSSFDTGIFGSISPEGMAIDYINRILFVTDSAHDTVFRITMDGNLISSFSTRTLPSRDYGPGPITFYQPTGTLFIASRDQYGDNISQTTTDGQFVSSFNGPIIPNGLQFDLETRNFLYISGAYVDYMGGPIHPSVLYEITTTGSVVRSWNLFNEHDWPLGITIDQVSNNYLVLNLNPIEEGWKWKIREYTRAGSYLGTFDLSTIGISYPQNIVTDPISKDLFIVENNSSYGGGINRIIRLRQTTK